VEISLHGTPTGSRIIAVDENGYFVREWKVPAQTRSLRLNISLFAKGFYRFVRPVRDGKTYRTEEFFYLKRENPRYRMNSRASILRGRFIKYFDALDLLPERRTRRNEPLPKLLPTEPISAPGLIAPLGTHIVRSARKSIAMAALALFGFITYSPVAYASPKGGETIEERQRPTAPADSTEDSYEYRWLITTIDTSGVLMENEFNRWAYKKNGLPITNSAGEDTTYTLTYGGEDYLCGVYADTASCDGGDTWLVYYRYIEGADIDSLESKWEGVTPLNGDIDFHCWDSTATTWVEIERIRGPPPMERRVGYCEVTDDSVYSNAASNVMPRPPPDSYEKSDYVDHTPYFLTISSNYVNMDTNEVFFLDLGRGEVAATNDSSRIRITNISEDTLDLGLSVDSVQYFTLLDSFYDPEADTAHAYCYGCYSLMAIFADSLYSPSPDSFDTGDFVTNDTTFADSSIFGPGGYALPPDSSVYLWFRFDAPEYYPLDSLALPVHLHIRQAEE